jgi:hypothetical protein
MFGRAAPHQPGAFRDQIVEFDRLQPQLQLAGLRLGEIEDVVDQ